MYDIDLIGKVVKSARIENNMSQERLSEILDVTPTHLKHIESGHRKPSIELFFKLMNVLDISIGEFCEENASEPDAEMSRLLAQCSEKELDVLKGIARVLIANL